MRRRLTPEARAWVGATCSVEILRLQRLRRFRSGSHSWGLCTRPARGSSPHPPEASGAPIPGILTPGRDPTA
ncbi:MAG: hypothetical protein AAFQ43_02140 [Bacteroidota bacterium]